MNGRDVCCFRFAMNSIPCSNMIKESGLLSVKGLNPLMGCKMSLKEMRIILYSFVSAADVSYFRDLHKA